MKDETYVFIQDSREKKAIARGSFNRRSHTGKGGRVRFPSDHLTKKELQAMNGEIKTYRMNEPMKWDEFKKLPDDLRISYIKSLRERFDVPDKYIAEDCLCIGKKAVLLELRRLGLSIGRAGNNPRKVWDRAGWNAWLGRVEEPEEIPAEPAPVEPVPAEPAPVVEPETIILRVDKLGATPKSGTMTFEGRFEDILSTVSAVLKGENVRLNVSWELLPEERV